MRYLLLLPVVCLFVSCVSTATKERVTKAEAALAELRQEALSHTPGIIPEEYSVRMDLAEEELRLAKAAAKKEKRASVLDIVGQVVQFLQPISGFAFPPLAGILGGLGGAMRGVASGLVTKKG